MIEQMMFFALGFFSAGLLTLFIAHAVWRRAVRLTTKRVQAALPVSLAEIKADRDQLRAEFAMAARKLEMSVEQLKSRGHMQLVDITRKNEQLRVVLDEVKERTTTIHELEQREHHLRSELLATEGALGEASQAAREAENKLAAAQMKLSERERELAEMSSLAHGRQVELAALQANLAHFENVVSDTQRALSDSTAAHQSKQQLLDRTQADLREAQSYRADIEAKMAATLEELQQQTQSLGLTQNHLNEDSDAVGALVAKAKALARRVEELMSERDTLDQEMTARIGEAEMRHDLLSKDFETFRAERAALEVRLGAVQAERDELTERLRQLENGAQSNWERERMENAMLRERMNDLAAEITALSLTFEGDGSPIRKIIAAAEADLQADAISHAKTPSTDAAGTRGQPSLAERVRILQARAVTNS